MKFTALATLIAILPPLVRSAATSNPFIFATPFLIPEFVDEVKTAVANLSDPSLATQAAQVENIPVFFWMDVAAKVDTFGTYLAAANASGADQLVQAVIYDLPDRDCAAAASAGEFSIANGGATLYKNYIDNIAAQIEKYPNVRVVLVIEPDALANLVTNKSVPKCAGAESTYIELVSYAISKLQQQNAWLYLDAGNSGWLGWPANLSPAAQLYGKVLSGAGINATVRGLATDVSSFNLLRGAEDKAAAPNPNYNEELYINALAPFLVQNNFPAHFIVDQSRSGVSNIRNSTGDWCNVLGAGLGIRPTTNTGNALIDASVKPPGESDGTTDSTAPRFDPHCVQSDAAQPAPQAGTWFQSYFETLVRNANPPLLQTVQ
ncbi:cellulase [Gautieria morchelliformis]|nr:cellulase [Gautieria morchelliformis]